MVARGLKAGDTFEDGGLTYEVLSVNKDGSYTSTVAEKGEEKPVKEDDGQPKTGRGKKTE